MAYIYRHIRLDKNEPFYIGIGDNSHDGTYPRAHSKKHRNNHWANIIKNTDYRVDIIMDDMTWEEACKKEKELICLYGRHDKNLGCLSNQTDGGDGGTGIIVKEETKEKIRNFQLGLNKKGKPGRVWTEESKQKLSKTITGHKHTEEAKEKMRKPRLNTEGYKRPKNKIECPHCGMMSQPALAHRWHFDNCKKMSNTMGG